MSKYHPILMKRVLEEQAKEKQQAKLKAEVGIENGTIVIGKKGVKDYTIAFIRCVLYVVFVLLIFIGLLTILNPISRQIIVDGLTGLKL